MREKAVLITGLAAAAVILGGATVAVAASTRTSGDLPLSMIGVNVDRSSHVSTATGSSQDDDANLAPLDTADRDQAANAALARVGQGSVIEVERESDGNVAYEVEVRLDNGSEVEVGLGADFAVLNQDAPEFDDD
ncbi:PepSY domain-containing protein [Pseudarthrobacter cellobiosi]|uniref:PepSY domain-containing protein n=1 Tax=Pseudarthrobacter cellobiosi TaxID=2953654 RepID=UPI00208F8242|nr:MULTISPECIES: PepSY domain-containing protein [unclassified Pseudarthrobacter]MCO4254002.1 PepSY domain-containing protein [Pseudarthrobacter sp. HLT1-5]MCO4273404.1 PepSY domain-containing protein [Pseudarthrobacter sp. HLT3-5]